MPGIITSSSTMSGGSADARAQRRRAVGRRHDVEVLGRELGFQQLDVGRRYRRRPECVPTSVYARLSQRKRSTVSRKFATEIGLAI